VRSPVLSTCLTWVLLALIFIAPVILRLYAEDDPRNGDPDSSPQDEEDPGGLLAAA